MILIFLHADKHQFSYKVILSLLMSMFNHSESAQNNNFVISCQYLRKGSRALPIFCNHFFFCNRFIELQTALFELELTINNAPLT